MNKTERLFASKRIGFEWMRKELILKRKGFILKLLGRAQRVDIEKERLHLETIREEGRIMTMDTSGMNDKERNYFENLKDQILARQQLE